MAEVAAKTDATEAMIASLSMPEGTWAASARNDALARLRSMGLPQRRDEYWKYTRQDCVCGRCV